MQKNRRTRSNDLVRLFFMLMEVPYVYLCSARYRKVTIWAQVQVMSGLNVVSEVPTVMPFSTAQATALA